MENLLTTYEFQYWTDDFILPETTINLNKDPFTDPFFMIQFRIQRFFEYLPEEADSTVEEPRGPFIVKSFYLTSNAVIGDDDNTIICEILRCVRVPHYRIPTVIGDVSSFARNIMSQPSNLGRPLLPIIIGIDVNTCDPRDLEIAHERKYGGRPEIEEEDKPIAKRQRIQV